MQKKYLVKMTKKRKVQTTQEGTAGHWTLHHTSVGQSHQVLHCTRVRLQDTVKKKKTEQAAEHWTLDSNPVELWIDAFVLTSARYELTSCECLIPIITCRADEDAEHRTVNSA